MEFICNKNEISDAIINVSKAVSSKTTIPALEGIKINLSYNSLELTGYDLSMGIKAQINVKSEDTGICVINARLFSDIIRKMPKEEILINVDEMLNVNIKSGKTNYNILALSSEEYPNLPDFDKEKNLFKINQSILKSMINQTNFAVSLSDVKPILTGELFDIQNNNFNMVAIDGYKLAIRNENILSENDFNFVVPSKSLQELSRILKEDDSVECNIYSDEKHVIFELSNYMIYSRLLAGEFHNYRASIPDKFKTEIIVKTKELLDCVDRCSLLVNEKNKGPVKFTIKNNVLDIYCKTDIGKIQEEIEIELSGDCLEIGFNNKYLVDALKSAETDKIRIQITSSNKAVKIVPLQGESFIFILMPVQIKG